MAAVMFRAIHGKRPPEATRRLKDDPCERLAKTHGGEYGAKFLDAIDKALAVEARMRPQTVDAWRAMIGEPAVKLDGRAVSRLAPWREKVEPVMKFVRARPAWAAGTVAGAVVIGALIWKLAQPAPAPARKLAIETPATA